MISGKISCWVCASAFGLAAALLTGQETTPVFRAGTKLVEVDVTVLDKKGNAVTGLGSADFTVLDNGKPRSIAFFRPDRAPASGRGAAAPAAPPSGVFSNHPPIGAPDLPANVAALVLDTINTPPQQSLTARAQMMRYLRTLAPRTRVAIFVMGRQLRTLYDFTDDAAALRAKLEKASLGSPVGRVTNYAQSVRDADEFVNLFAFDPATLMADTDVAGQHLKAESIANDNARRYRMELTLAALEALGGHLAGVPGRKSLVWIGAGIAMQSMNGDMGAVEDFHAKVRRVSERLAQLGIVLYIVDSQALVLPAETSADTKAPVLPRSFGRFDRQANTESLSANTRPAVELMASVTGGRYFHDSNDLAAGFEQAAIDFQGSYTLGFYMPEEADDKWHKLRVRVQGPGMNVRHKEGYFARSTKAQPGSWTMDVWRAKFAEPVGSTAILLSATSQRLASGEIELAVTADAAGLELRPDGDGLNADLEVGIVDRAADGTASAHCAGYGVTLPVAPTARDVVYRVRWKPDPGSKGVRVVVRDTRSGEYGSLDIPLGDLPRR